MIKSIVFACLAVAAFAEPEAKPEADAALLYAGAYGYPYAYGAYPYGFRSYAYGAYPYTYGAHYIGKREAEAEAKPEADAALLYAGAYGYPYTYGAYPYGYRSYAYGAYPYAYGAYYIGKREAEAKPEADADAALLYGAYG